MNQLPIKNYVIVGSYALGIRPAKDIDVICFEKDVECEYKRNDDYSGSFMLQGRKIELLFVDKQRSLQLFLNCGEIIAPYYVLYAMKAGHIHYPSRQWEKHIADYHTLKRMCSIANVENKYLQFDESFRKLHHLVELHKESTKERLGIQRLPKLKNTTKERFFDDKVIKYYEHDDIHQWFAHKEKPMYTYMQKDSTLVDCDFNLWNKFTLNEKLQCVMEECYVIASERHLIPNFKKGIPVSIPPVMDRYLNTNVGLTPENAFKWALMRVCTTLCSGWFREFALESYFVILNSYNKDYPLILNKHIK